MSSNFLPQRFETRRDARAAGWFSRRHETRDAHDEAVLKYQASSARHRAKDAGRRSVQSVRAA